MRLFAKIYLPDWSFHEASFRGRYDCLFFFCAFLTESSEREPIKVMFGGVGQKLLHFGFLFNSV